jgi:hypothetical protein
VTRRIRRGRGTGYKAGEAHHRARHPNDVVERARELHEQHGLSYELIGMLLQISQWTVREWCAYRTRVVA